MSSTTRFSFCCTSSAYLYLIVASGLFYLSLSNQNLHDVICMESERQALVQFKHGLVDEVGRLASWVDDQESDCCRWVGIACDNSTGHVRRIHLPGAINQMLGGDLSPSLLHLKKLRHLDLSCNNFGGIQIPSFIGSLGNLRYLNLSRSEFGGIVPPQLGNLSELRVLCLGNVFLPTSIANMQWLSSLRVLHHLDLSNVDLSKATNWLQVINTLPSLVKLYLSNSQLSDIKPRVPSLNLTSLSVLNLSSNYFNTSVPPWIFSLTSLVSLDLSSCSFHGLIPSSKKSFRNLTSLELLHVQGNHFMNSSSVLKELSAAGSNLISLDISSCGVTSSVLNSLHNLTSLLSLDVSYNQLTNTVPKSLGNLCVLREIDLSYMNSLNISLAYLLENFFDCKSPSLESLSIFMSGLSGYIPDQLGQLIHLKTLQLSDNQISGTIPDSIGRLSFLGSLNLAMNMISGPIPYSIGRLSSLEVLDLSQNQLNDSLPESVGQLLKLKFLDVSYNFLSGVVTEAHFAKLASLKHLGGIGNNFTLMTRLAKWTPPFQLKYLYLDSWGLGPRFPSWLLLQRGLIELGISNTGISSPMPDSFWRHFPNLTYLDMSHNHIQGTLSDIPATLDVLNLNSNEFKGGLPNISDDSFQRVLDLSNNLFEGSLDHLLCSNGLSWIEVLSLGNNKLSGAIPECWEKCPSLSFLNLENNNLSGGIPTTLGFLSQLQALKMHGNKLSGRLPDSLMSLTGLEILQLGRNELVGSIPAWFGRNLASLSILNLRSNNLHGNIPHELCYLTSIQILDLAQNNLSGNIPRCFNNFSILSGKAVIDDQNVFLSVGAINVIGSDSLVMKGREDTYNTILGLVTLLDLSSNNFVGHIPNELTALRELRSLNLSRNQLTGRIQDNIGDMKALETFDLSLNKLLGELPMSLSSLTFLLSFNVSCNNLTGRVPTSTQLQSFNESSFFGNKLCGDPLPNSCVRVVPDTGPNTDHINDNGPHGGADLALVIGMMCGFIVGFWVIVAPLMISRSWRIAYYHFLSELRYMVYDVIHKFCFNIFCK